MFKKIILSLSVVLLLSSNAYANFFEKFIPQNPIYSPYAGIDAGIGLSSLSGFPYNVHAGLGIDSEGDIDLGFEGFFQGYTNKSEDFNLYTRTYKHYAFGLDAIAYYPAFNNIDYALGLGLSYHLFSIDYVHDKSISQLDSTLDDNKFGINFLAGLQYYVMDNISVRARAKYFLAHGNIDLTIGANFHF